MQIRKSCLHEAGHIIRAYRFGIKVYSVAIYAQNYHSKFSGHITIHPRQYQRWNWDCCYMPMLFAGQGAENALMRSCSRWRDDEDFRKIIQMLVMYRKVGQDDEELKKDIFGEYECAKRKALRFFKRPRNCRATLQVAKHLYRHRRPKIADVYALLDQHYTKRPPIRCY